MNKAFILSACLLLFFSNKVKASMPVYEDTIKTCGIDPNKANKSYPINQHYISVNTTFFIKQLLTVTNANVTVTSSPYIFEYKFLHHNHGVRFGLGGSLSYKKDFPDSTQVTITNSHTFDMRLGYVYQTKLSKSWSFFAGFDIIGQTASTVKRVNTNLDITSSTDDNNTIGFGPSMGVQVNFNKRIGMFTESSIYYTFNDERIGNSLSSFPNFNNSEKILTNKIEFFIPTSLYFFVRF